MSKSEVRICPALLGRIAEDSSDEKYPLSFTAFCFLLVVMETIPEVMV